MAVFCSASWVATGSCPPLILTQSTSRNCAAPKPTTAAAIPPTSPGTKPPPRFSAVAGGTVGGVPPPEPDAPGFAPEEPDVPAAAACLSAVLPGLSPPAARPAGCGLALLVAVLSRPAPMVAAPLTGSAFLPSSALDGLPSPVPAFGGTALLAVSGTVVPVLGGPAGVLDAVSGLPLSDLDAAAGLGAAAGLAAPPGLADASGFAAAPGLGPEPGFAPATGAACFGAAEGLASSDFLPPGLLSLSLELTTGVLSLCRSCAAVHDPKSA